MWTRKNKKDGLLKGKLGRYAHTKKQSHSYVYM